MNQVFPHRPSGHRPRTPRRGAPRSGQLPPRRPPPPPPDGTDPGAVFVEVVTFYGLARTVADHLAKGRQVAVSGRLEQNEWTAEDGSKRSRLQIIADEVTFLDRPKAEAGVA